MKKPLRVAAWSGLLSLVLSIVVTLYMLSSGARSGSPVISFAGGVLSILFLYGFLVLGNKFKNTLLLIMTWIGIAFMVVFMILSLFVGANSAIPNVSAQELGQSGLASAPIALLILWFVVSVFFGAYSVLFGVGLLKIGDKVKHAKTSGILEIIAGATYIIFIGLLIRVAANVFEILMFFEASKKFEN